MTIQKILNNNVAIALDAQGKECVVTGKGITYGRKQGDAVDETLVQKVFSPREKGVAEKLSYIVENLPLEHIKVCDEIINTAKRELKGTLGDKIYLGLIDHVSFAIERHQDGVDLTSSLKWEMKHFYPEEFRVGMMALDIIEKRLALRLPDDEAAFIAFHLVNAGAASPGDRVEDSLAMISGVLGIVREAFGIDFDEDSLTYNRFLTHLKFFSMRVFSGQEVPGLSQTSGGMLYRLQGELPAESACVDKIADYLKTRFGHKTSDDERTYLIIHIHSMLTR